MDMQEHVDLPGTLYLVAFTIRNGADIVKMYIDELQCRASVGVFDWEKQVRQTLIINVGIELLNPLAAITDGIEETLSYKALSRDLVEHVQSQHFGLIERIASELCQLVLRYDSRVIRVEVEVNKPGALSLSRNVRVVEWSERNQAIIGLGSNIDPALHIARAKQAIDREFCVSAWADDLRTKAVARNNDPDFINTAVLIQTALDKHSLSKRLKHLEWELGRTAHDDNYGARIIDLDLLMWNQRIEDADVFTRDFLRLLIDALQPGLFPLICAQYSSSV